MHVWISNRNLKSSKNDKTWKIQHNLYAMPKNSCIQLVIKLVCVKIFRKVLSLSHFEQLNFAEVLTFYSSFVQTQSEVSELTDCCFTPQMSSSHRRFYWLRSSGPLGTSWLPPDLMFGIFRLLLFVSYHDAGVDPTDPIKACFGLNFCFVKTFVMGVLRIFMEQHWDTLVCCV